MDAIELGTNNAGLRFARMGEWLVVAYAMGGYSVQREVPGIGRILADDFPLDVERALCAALGINCGL